MSVVQSIAHAVEPWQSAYNNSPAVSTSVIFVHLGAMLFGGGVAIAADRATLRASRSEEAEKRRMLRELDTTHAVVIAALVVSFASGLALAAADVKNFATSPVFWTKMSFVVLLLLNGWVLRSAERGAMNAAPGDNAARFWQRLRTTSLLSIALWTCVLLAGTILVNAT
jgi:uncharacterized membrane protein